jgi:uncharacterized membrane protein
MPEITFIDETWTVEGTAEEAYEFFTDVEDWSRWASRVNSSSRKGGEEPKKGDIVVFEPDLLVSVPLQTKILRVEPSELISWGVQYPGFRLEHGFEFKNRNGQCVIRQFEVANGSLALLGIPLKPLLKSFDRQWGDDLEQALS